MPCNLTAGFTLDACKDLHGGAKSLRITELANVSSITETAGVITAITMVATKKFYNFIFKKEVINFKETENVDEENDTAEYVIEVTAKKNALTTTTRNTLLLLAQNTLCIIAEDNNGKYWLLGEKYGLTKSGSRESGTKFADFNGSMLTFKGKEIAPFKEVDSSIIAALTA
jgi:hypothetical protein